MTHNHDHHHGKCNHNHHPPKTIFGEVSGYIKENKVQSAALLASLTVGAAGLIGTTALTPFITSPWGAGAALIGGLALLIQNSRTTIENILPMGKKMGMAAGTLGVMIGSINTIPEVFVSVGSALQGAMDLGTGNIIGSNIAHMLVVLGVPAAVMEIGKSKDLSWQFNTCMMAGTAALFGAQLVAGAFSPLAGIGMLGMGGYYIHRRLFSKNETIPKHKHEHHHDHDHTLHHQEEIGSCLFHDHSDDKEEKQALARPKWLNTVLSGGGMLGLAAAANLIVKGGSHLAASFNTGAAGAFTLTEATIGTLIVAIGTSLPEIAISIEAIRKKQSDLAIGNVLGCSIVNTLIAGGILSASGLLNDFSLASIPVPDAFNIATKEGLLNTGFFIGTAAVMTGALFATKGAVNRWMGGASLLAYTGYVLATLTLNNGVMPETRHHHGSGHDDNTVTLVEKAPQTRPSSPLLS